MLLTRADENVCVVHFHPGQTHDRAGDDCRVDVGDCVQAVRACGYDHEFPLSATIPQRPYRLQLTKMVSMWFH